MVHGRFHIKAPKGLMVYLYYGFFLLLLYMISPLWVFLLVTVISLWAMRSSLNLRKVIKLPVGRLASRGILAVEPKKGMKKSSSKAWVERRKFNRVAVSLEVTYVIAAKRSPKGTAQSGRATAEQLLPLSKRLKVGKTIIKDLSEGGLCIIGDEAFTKGQRLALFVQFPQANDPITILAEVRSCRSATQAAKTTYKAGLRIVDLDLEEMAQLMDYLFSQRS